MPFKMSETASQEYMQCLIDGFASKEGFMGPILVSTVGHQGENLEDSACQRARRCSSNARYCNFY